MLIQRQLAQTVNLGLNEELTSGLKLRVHSIEELESPSNELVLDSYCRD